MLELNTSEMIQWLLIFMMFFFLLMAGIIGYRTLEYQQFESQVHEVVTRIGTYGSKRDGTVNNQDLINLINNYHGYWVVEPVPSLSEVDPNDLLSNEIDRYTNNQDYSTGRALMLKDMQNDSQNARQVTTDDYFMDRCRLHVSASESKVFAKRYQEGQFIPQVKSEYWDLSSWSAEAMVKKHGDDDKTMTYTGKPGQLKSYRFPNSLYVKVARSSKDGKAPRVLYGHDMTYQIVANPHHILKFMNWSSEKIINATKGQGQDIIHATNQIRSQNTVSSD